MWSCNRRPSSQEQCAKTSPMAAPTPQWKRSSAPRKPPRPTTLSCRCRIEYESMVEARGANLSGGQKQRIAIARALLTRPSVLILDDSTSSVDLDTELRLQEALAEKNGRARQPSSSPSELAASSTLISSSSSTTARSQPRAPTKSFWPAAKSTRRSTTPSLKRPETGNT